MTDFNDKSVMLKCDDTGSEHTVSHTFIGEKTRLGFRFTIASAQGRNLNGSVAIWDTKHQRFSKIHLFDRARQANLVSNQDE